MTSPITSPSPNHAQDLINIFNGQTGAAPFFGTPKPLFTETGDPNSDRNVEIKPTCELPEMSERVFQFNKIGSLVVLASVSRPVSRNNDQDQIKKNHRIKLWVKNVKILKSGEQYKIEFDWWLSKEKNCCEVPEEPVLKKSVLLISSSGFSKDSVMDTLPVVFAAESLGNAFYESLKYYAEATKDSWGCPGFAK